MQPLTQDVVQSKQLWAQDYLGRLELHRNGMQSIAGYGSSLGCVPGLLRELPRLWSELGVTSVLDIPCGDFYWMSQISLPGLVYIGADLLEEQIQWVHDHVGPDTLLRSFRVLNMVTDVLPCVDLIFSRDCLVHLPFRFIMAAVRQCCASGSTYLMAGHCPEVTINLDMEGLIGWRPLNLELAPFGFPPALRVISEEYDMNPEKCMGLWRLADIHRHCGL